MSRFVVRIGTPVVLLALLIVFVACGGKPAPGKPCKNVGRYVCMDPTTALYCNAGTYQAIPCKGTKGCSGGTVNPACDDDLAQEGDTCMATMNENHACSTDHTKGLVCKDGKYTTWLNCRGPTHCVVKPVLNSIECDDSYAENGDVCEKSGQLRCSVDRKMALRCRSGKYENDNSCRGQKECRYNNNSLHCDDSVALEGDPCDTQDEVACSIDGKIELSCKANKYVKKQDCKRKDGCVVKEGTLYCAF
jgi:hypothetical protein